MLSRTLSVFVLLLGLHAGAAAQSATQDIRFEFRDYSVDSLRWFNQQVTVPDTFRVFVLNRLADAVSSTNLPRAVRYASAAVDLSHRIGYARGEMNSLRVLANLEAEIGNFVIALGYYQQGLALAQARRATEQLAQFYLNMGATATMTGDSERSLRYLLLSYKYFKQVKNGRVTITDTATVFSNLGNTYFHLHRFALGREFTLRAAHLFKATGTAQGISEANLLLGRIHQRETSSTAGLDSAGNYLRHSILLNTQGKDSLQQAGTLLNLAQLYQQQRRFPAMLDAAAQALRLATKVGSVIDQAQASALLAHASAALGDYHQAYDNSVSSALYNTAVMDAEKSKQLAQLQAKYDAQAREQQIRLLQQQARVDAALAREQLLFQRGLLALAGLLFAGLAGGSILYRRLQRRRRQLATANLEIKEAMAEKEVLVQEIHHRVKNNLQLVSSLLSWQSSSLPDPALVEVLAGSQSRIRSLAMVHEFLYRADNLSQVRLDTYLTELLDSLHKSLTLPYQPITLSTDLAPLIMDARDASNFGLLVNELVTNAYKHAFNKQASGNLHIILAQNPNGFLLRVVDNGVGMPPPNRPVSPGSLGMQLIKTLAKQLKATVVATNNYPTGTCIEVARAN